MNFRTVSVYAVGIALGAALSLITLPILAWLFPPEDVGRVSLFQLSLSLIVVFFSFGLDQSYVRNFNEVEDKVNLARICMMPGFFALLIGVALVGMYAKQLSYWLFDLDSLLLYGIFSFAVVVLYLERFFSVFIRMKELSFAYSLTRVFPKLLFLIFVFGVFLFPAQKSFVLLAGMQSLCWLLVVLIMLCYLKDEYLKNKKLVFEFRATRELFYFGFPLMLNGIAFWGLSFLDRIMLKELSSLSELGVYAVASTLAGAAILFQQIFTTMWHPVIYRWVSEGAAEVKLKNINESVQLFSLVLICIIALCSFVVIYVLPEAYVSARYMLPACMVPPLHIMITEVSGIGISISKRTKFLPVITLVCVLVNLGFNYFLIPTFGAGGAAASTALAFSLYLILKTEVSNRVWVSFSNAKFYIFSSSVVALCVISALVGEALGYGLYVAWVAALCLCILGYKAQVRLLYGFIRGRI